MNKNLKCKCHGEYKPRESLIQTPKGRFCSYSLAIEWANKQTSKRITAKNNKAKKEQRRKDVTRLKELRSRSEWFEIYQKLTNQYVREVKEVGEPCCTCNEHKEKYDAGHFKAVGRGGADRRRFNLFNIHNQCRHCNSFNGGRPIEYREFLIERYGIDKVLWLEDESQHPTLKELFPTTKDIEIAIDEMRQLLRDNNVKPKT